MCWASSTAHSWKSINSAGEQGEEKRGKMGGGGEWETKSESLDFHTWGSRELPQSSLLASTPLSWAASTAALPSTSPLLLEHLSAGQPPPEQVWEGTDRGRWLWGGGVRFVSPIMLTINLYLMTVLHQEMTKQPPHVSCPQDTDQLTLLSPSTNNWQESPKETSPTSYLVGRSLEA